MRDESDDDLGEGPRIQGQFLHELRAGQLNHVSYLSFIVGQLQWGIPVLVGILGGWSLLASPRFASQRLAGWACVLVEVVLMASHGKPYYASPVMPTLIAAGAVVLSRPRLRVAAVILSVLFGVLVFPISLPVLSPAGTASYISAMHMDFTRRNNQGNLEVLPQDFADMLGWEEQVIAVRRAYDTLDEAQRRELVIGASNYGRAGALDFFGPRYGLPAVVSTAGSFWFFGPGERPGNTALVVEDTDRNLLKLWQDVRLAGTIHSEWSVGEERDTKVWLCQRPRKTIQDAWPALN